RHIVDIFKKEGTTNVKWVWAPMNYSFPDEPWNAWEKSYPGNNYVDWIGFDGYNWGTTQSWSQWQVFKYMFRDQVRMARKMWPGKPIMVAEFASADKGGDKAAWIREIPDYLKSSMRDINAIIWFDVKKEADWRINSTPRSLAAFKEIMKDPIFSSSAKGLISATSYSMSSQNKKAIAVKALNSPKIDGNLSDWDKTSPIVMKDKSFFKEGLSWKGPTDLSGNIYLMWDEKNLYLAAEVKDVLSPANKKQKQDIWNGDAIEMVMGTNPANNSNRTSFGPGDYQVGFGVGDGASNTPSIWCWQRRRSPQDGEISVKKIAAPQGYILEAKVPWEFFKDGFVPSSGTNIGFDIALDDADNTGEREKQLIWNGDYMFYSDPSEWGVLSFK
ncbi:MAG: sugar-binding protein, partial [Candidatus Margulisiibacteriota bacterium]